MAAASPARLDPLRGDFSIGVLDQKHVAAGKKFTGHFHRFRQHASRIVAQIQDDALNALPLDFEQRAAELAGRPVVKQGDAQVRHRAARQGAPGHVGEFDRLADQVEFLAAAVCRIEHAEPDGRAGRPSDQVIQFAQRQPDNGVSVHFQNDVARPRAGAQGRGAIQGRDDDGAVVLRFDFDADTGEMGAHGGGGVAAHFRVEIGGVAGVAQGISHALNGGMGGGFQGAAVHVIAVDDIPGLGDEPEVLFRAGRHFDRQRPAIIENPGAKGQHQAQSPKIGPPGQAP